MATRRPPDPHLWASTADSLYPGGPVGRLAREYVTVRERSSADRGRPGTALKLSIATNLDFSDPRRIEHTSDNPRRDLGVPWPAEGREYAWAAEAVSARLLVELQARDTLRAWTLRQLEERPPVGATGRKGYRSSVRRLAEELVNTGIQGVLYRVVPALKPLASVQRAVERWIAEPTEARRAARNAPVRPSPVNRPRVDILRGDPPRAVREFLAHLDPTIEVVGDWKFSGDPPHFTGLGTDPDDDVVEGVRAILLAKGRGFVKLIESVWSTEENALQLVRLHGLRVEVILP